MQKMLNEDDMKRRLCRYIRRSNWKRSDTLISEYFVDNASRRVDLVAANGHLAAFEIKSDLDNLGRLPGQIEVFARCFETVTVVCTQRHLASVLSIIPETVGLTCISDKSVTVERAPVICQIESLDIWFSHLPLTIIRELLSARSIKSPRTGRGAILAVARENITVAEARTAVLRYIKTEKRQQRVSQAQERSSLPKIDPLVAHREMLHDYLQSRGISFV